MQVVGTRPLALHRRHPDARGLVLAHPLNAQRSDGFQDATGRDGSKWAYSGGLALSSFGTWARGYGISGNGTLNQNLLSPLTQQIIAAGSDFTFMAQVRLDTAAAFQVILNTSGFAHGFSANKMIVWSSVGAQFVISTVTYPSGSPLSVGVRYRNSTAKYQFFLNGASEAEIVGTAPTYAAFAGYLGGGLGGSGGWTGVMSDIRLYNRYMPADTFMRAYRQPLGIYRVVSPSFARFSSSGGRFLPFLRPGY